MFLRHDRTAFSRFWWNYGVQEQFPKFNFCFCFYSYRLLTLFSNFFRACYWALFFQVKPVSRICPKLTLFQRFKIKKKQSVVIFKRKHIEIFLRLFFLLFHWLKSHWNTHRKALAKWLPWQMLNFTFCWCVS